MRDLTPEEQAQLEEMMGDNTTAVRFNKDDVDQRKLLSGLLQDHNLSDGIGLVESTYWTIEAHCTAFGILKKFWTEYASLPTRFIVTERLKDLLKDADPAAKLHKLAEIECVYDYFVPGLVESKYMLDELHKWAKEQALRLNFALLAGKNTDGEMNIDQTRMALSSRRRRVK